MSESFLVIDDLHVTLSSAAGEVNILRGIDLNVPRGERVSIVGPSGAGKSTLMMVVAGLEQPTRGRVTLAGTDLSRLDEDELAEFRQRNIGIVFQAFRLIPTMNALENVALPLELAGVDDAFARATDTLGKVGLGHRLQHYPEQLSGGEQQRVALARAAVVEPALLLADEPTGNLDTATGDQIIDLLFELRERVGCALLLITHDARLAARCDRTVRMNDGLITESSQVRLQTAVGEP